MNGIQSCVNFFQTYEGTEHIHWKMYFGMNARQGAVMASTETINKDGSLDHARALVHLRTSLNLLREPGVYMLQVKKAPNANGDIYTHYFDVDPMSTQSNNNTLQPFVGGMMPAKGFVTEELLTAKLEAQAAQIHGKYKEESFTQQLKEIRDELREAKKNTGSEIGKQLLTAFNTAVQMYQMSKGIQTGPQISINGNIAQAVPPQDNTSTEETTDEEKAEAQKEYAHYKAHFDKAITEIFAREGTDKAGVTLIYCLNRFAQDNPEIYNTIKPQILQYANEIEYVEN